MKFINQIAAVCLVLFVVACQPAAENTPDPGVEAFERNSETVMKIIRNWETENVDYSLYASDFYSPPTGFGDMDTLRLEGMKEEDARVLNIVDFKVSIDSINLLPGVDPMTKKIDGSVRWYSQWDVTRTATDSTEARTGTLNMYQVWTFNEEGKVAMQLGYADFGNLIDYLWEEDDAEESDDN